MARSHFDVYLGDGALIHVKDPCIREDVLYWVVIKVFAEDPKDLSRRARSRGWEKVFRSSPTRCHAVRGEVHGHPSTPRLSHLPHPDGTAAIPTSPPGRTPRLDSRDTGEPVVLAVNAPVLHGPTSRNPACHDSVTGPGRRA